jgi:hypothetical protein
VTLSVHPTSSQSHQARFTHVDVVDLRFGPAPFRHRLVITPNNNYLHPRSIEYSQEINQGNQDRVQYPCSMWGFTNVGPAPLTIPRAPYQCPDPVSLPWACLFLPTELNTKKISPSVNPTHTITKPCRGLAFPPNPIASFDVPAHNCVSAPYVALCNVRPFGQC